jgi:hypothetical protein
MVSMVCEFNNNYRKYSTKPIEKKYHKAKNKDLEEVDFGERI